MTTLERIPAICVACGGSIERTEVTSTFTGGGPDLDLRPAPLARDLHVFSVTPCGTCTFPNVADDDPGDSGISRLIAGFQPAEMFSDNLPEMIVALRQRALLEREAGDGVRAGLFFLHAAWSADDEGMRDLARMLRLDATVSWEVAMKEGQLPADDADSSAVLVTDTLRRAGEFKRADAAARSGLESATDDMIRSLLDFEIQLIGSGDSDCHSVDEVHL